VPTGQIADLVPTGQIADLVPTGQIADLVPIATSKSHANWLDSRSAQASPMPIGQAPQVIVTQWHKGRAA
jgi:hypothetical protein